MVGRIAERVIHQHGVRHRWIDRAETVLAIEALGDKGLGGANGAAAHGRWKEGLGALEQPIDRAEELDRGPVLMRAGRPFAHGLRRRDEQLSNRDAARIGGAGFKRLQHEQRDHHGARPIGDLVEMKGKPARQKHDLDRHGRNSAPWNGAIERQQEAGEDVALRRAAMGENGFARMSHMRRLDIVADHLERKIGLDAGAHIEWPRVNERPAAMVALNAPKIDGDQALEFEVRLFATKMPQQHIFGRDRRIRLEFETPMAVLVLTGEQRLRGARDVALERLRRRRDLRSVEGDVHVPTLMARRLGASAPDPIMIEAALYPERTAPSMVAGRPVWTQSPASTTFAH